MICLSRATHLSSFDICGLIFVVTDGRMDGVVKNYESTLISGASLTSLLLGLPFYDLSVTCHTSFFLRYLWTHICCYGRPHGRCCQKLRIHAHQWCLPHFASPRSPLL